MISVEWIGLSLVGQLGGQTFRRLLAHYNHDLHAILNAPSVDLMQIKGIGKKIASDITHIDLEHLRLDIQDWQGAGITLHDWYAPTYPPALRGLDDAPPLLFTLGNWQAFSPFKAGAVIGTRQPSPQAQTYAQDIAFSLADLGLTVVSGLALGIDTAGHMGALAHPQGRTIAVLGSGVHTIYPPQNRALAQAILKRGALLSENAPGAGAIAPRLVARNRLITSLVEHVFIIETDVNGGAMHAGRFAQKQGRRVYTFDLPASGNQALIADGAIIIPPDSLAHPATLARLLTL